MTAAQRLLCLLAAALLCANARAAPPPTARLQDALQRGREAAAPCAPATDADDVRELLPCVNQRAPADGSPRRLGAAFVGWHLADSAAAYGVEEAESTAAALFREWLPLQRRLAVSDAQLCALVSTPCERIVNRKRELQSEGR